MKIFERLSTLGEREKIDITKNEWEDLNRNNDLYPGGEEARNATIARLRIKYAGSPKALHNLDRFDPNSEYFQLLVKLREYSNSGDTVGYNKASKRLQQLENF